MDATASFLLSLCAAALLFSLVTWLTPDKGVRTAATAFLLVVLLRGLAGVQLSFDKQSGQSDTPLPNADRTVAATAKEALSQAAADRLAAAGCVGTVEAELSYGDNGFTDLSLTVFTDADEATVLAALAEWKIPVTVIANASDKRGVVTNDG